LFNCLTWINRKLQDTRNKSQKTKDQKSKQWKQQLMLTSLGNWIFWISCLFVFWHLTFENSAKKSKKFKNKILLSNCLLSNCLLLNCWLPTV
jgi:hypothetical protein